MNESSQSGLTKDPELLLSLYRISQIGTSAFNVREAFQSIMEELQRLFLPTSAAISLISPNSGMLEIEYALGYPSNLDELSLHVGKGVAGRVAFTGKPILLEDVATDSRYVKLVESAQCKMVVPMISEGQIIGVINVDSDKKGRYRPSDLDRLAAIADEDI